MARTSSVTEEQNPDPYDIADRYADDRARAEYNAERLRLIRLAQDASTQTASPLVQLVLARAGEESATAFEEFLTCNPHDIEKVKELQWRAARPLLIAGWLKEVVDGAAAAEQELRAQDYAENQPE